ncbi:MFS transporter [Novosphingobium album (ex Liu et al. 2023)]|uniref:MFS transporter n=1 Tax=Novosphingobium album (ex Liu et al. 2023) TaxID=3031130 RepID=A0ABT5WXL2_9SPHN|nr:MFS transporter [Novosphingobium album (ex Liu et al. 2023)]MDE8654599.1 MFS transporter [Novosphingobium album (ex Liu et al. 2023)]
MRSLFLSRFGSGALRHANFRHYFVGQAFLLIGNWIHSLALAWLVWRLSHSPFLLGLLVFCDLGPSLVLGPLVGAVADRVDRRRLLIVTQCSQMLLAAALAMLVSSEAVTAGIVVAAALAMGTVSAFDIAGRQAIVGELVDRADLRNAIALNAVIFNMARLVGPAMSGILIASLGEGSCFVIKAFAALPLIAILWRMPLPVQPRQMQITGFFRDVADGLAFVAANAPARYYLSLLGLGSLTSVPYFSFLPMLANQILGGEADMAGMLMSVTGIGALAAAIVLLVRTSLPLVGVFVAASALQGLTLVLIGLSDLVWVTTLLALPMGCAALSQQFAANALLQGLVPNAMRGRIMALYTMMLIGVVPVGGLIAGFTIELFGLPASTIAAGILCIALTSWIGFHLYLSDYRRDP